MWSCGSAGLCLLSLIGACGFASPSFSEEKCIPRSGFFFEHEQGEYFAGLFRIALNPPDLRDAAAVQRHVALAETWGEAISREILTRAGGLCSVIIVPEGFPDLRAFLIVHRTAPQIDRERLACTHVLEDILNHFEPGDDLVKRVVEWNRSLNRPEQPSSGADAVDLLPDTWNISQAALRLIYEEGSILQALVSVGADAFASIDPADLRAWIRSQRSPSRPPLEQISHCLPPHADLASSADIPHERLNSAILRTGEINLSRAESGPLPPGPLRYMVMVGDPVEPPTLSAHSEVETKYCQREHTFSIGEVSSQRISVTLKPRCHGTSVYDLDAWNLIWCDPKDCTSEHIEKAVMAAITSDPEILEFARRSSNTAVPRGPYFISVK